MGKRQQKQEAPAPGSSRRRFLLILLAITAVAFALRLGTSIELLRMHPAVAQPMESTDMHTYQMYAKQILAGEYNYDEGFYYQPFYYAVFLPIVYLLSGGSAWGVVIVQSLLGAACVALIGLAFGRLFGRWTGWLGAGLLALYKMHIFYSPFTLIALLQSFWISLFLYLVVVAWVRKGIGWWLGAALVLGLANLTRGNMILLLPLLVILGGWRLRSTRKLQVLSIIGMLVIFYLPQLPFAWVNYKAHDRWTGPSSAAGAVLAIGNTPEAPPGGREADTGAGPMLYPPALKEWSRLDKLPEPERVTISQSIVDWFKDEPLAYIELKARMLLLFWHRSEIPNNVALTDARGQPLPITTMKLPVLLGFGLIGSLGLAGMIIVGWQRRKSWLGWFGIGTVLIYSGSIVLFYILARFRVPIVPVLCGFGGVALTRFGMTYRLYKTQKKTRPLIVCLVAVIIAFSVVNMGFDVYRYSLESTVMRLARPDGVRVQLQNETVIYDHGPMQFGGWLPVSASQVGTITKSFSVKPEEITSDAFLRIAVAVQQPPARIGIEFSDDARYAFDLEPGITWIDLPLPSGLQNGAVTMKFVSLHGDTMVFFDNQRDYGRTTPSSQGELVMTSSCQTPRSPTMLNRFTLTTPLGDVHLLWEPGASTLSEIQLPGAKHQTSPATNVASADIPPAIAERIDKLDAYFHGDTVTFTPDDLDGLSLTPFTRRVYEHVMSIPAGETRTYGQVATAIGNPGAARAVGNAMANNPIPLLMPCHRIVATNGLGGFTSGLHHKRHLLDHELQVKS